jgi:hypothetical protein
VIVRFPAYRRFSEASIEVNDAMMALLVGARLGEHALKNSAASRDVLLPSLFGQIPGIARLNRTTSDAAHLLANAETHLAYMAIPYALAVHSSFIVSAAGMVRDDGRDDPEGLHGLQRQEDLTKLRLGSAHEYIAKRCGTRLDGTLLPLFHVARRIRNRIVHYGGTTGSRLASEYRDLPDDVRESWEHLAGRPLTAAIEAKRLVLNEGELIAVLAVSRYLVQEINDLLAQTLSRTYWASLAVNDYGTAHPERFGERNRQLRRIRGYTQRLYKPLHLTDEELSEAIGEGGSSH